MLGFFDLQATNTPALLHCAVIGARRWSTSCSSVNVGRRGVLVCCDCKSPFQGEGREVLVPARRASDLESSQEAAVSTPIGVDERENGVTADQQRERRADSTSRRPIRFTAVSAGSLQFLRSGCPDRHHSSSTAGVALW